MPKEWYLMSRPLFNSGSENDEFLAYGQDGFQELLESVIADDVLIYDKSLRSEPKTIRAIIQNVTGDSSNGTYYRQLLCAIGNLECGQYVKARDAWWLVSTPPDNNKVYEKAVLWKCKYTIRFLSPIDGEIVEYPVYSINSTQYGTGEANRQNVSVGEDQHLVYVPCNDETVIIDDRFRFIMDRNREKPTVYRITKVDTTSYAGGSESSGGLIEWHTTEAKFNDATDSKELMIADYYKPSVDEAEYIPPDADGKIMLYDADGDQRIALGEEKEIRVSYQLGESETPVFDYTAQIISGDGIGEIRSQKDDVIILFVPKDRGFVGKVFKLRVACERLSKEAELPIQVVNW